MSLTKKVLKIISYCNFLLMFTYLVFEMQNILIKYIKWCIYLYIRDILLVILKCYSFEVILNMWKKNCFFLGLVCVRLNTATWTMVRVELTTSWYKTPLLSTTTHVKHLIEYVWYSINTIYEEIMTTTGSQKDPPPLIDDQLEQDWLNITFFCSILSLFINVW